MLLSAKALDPDLVTAAARGDRAALESVAEACLPLVYTVVGRAADADLDVDDIVQETMVRVTTQLAGLRRPYKARAWVVAVALRQTAEARRAAGLRRRTTEPSAVFDDDADGFRANSGAGGHGGVDGWTHGELGRRRGQGAGRSMAAEPDFVDFWMLRDALEVERRQIGRAARWLDPALRDVLAVWSLEIGGRATREQTAESLGVSASHAAVRVRRMRQQLDTARRIERALAAHPRCAGLGEAVRGWDGVPAPLWRKRVDRHVRKCAQCAATGGRLVPLERLMAGVPLAFVPALLASRLGKVLGMRLTGASGLSGAAGVNGAGAAGATRAGGGPGGTRRLGGGRNSGGTRSGRPRAGLRARLVVAGASVISVAAVVVAGLTGPHLSSGISTVSARGGAEASTPGAVSASASRSATAAVKASASAAKKTSASVPSSGKSSGSSSAGAGPGVANGLLPQGAFSPTVPAVPGVTAADFGTVDQNGRVAGRDDGQSTLLNGESVWVFDDTTLQDPWGFLSNSGAATDDLDAADGVDLQSADVFTTTPGGTPQSLIPLTAPEQAFQAKHATSTGCTSSSDPYCGAIYGFWPGPVIADPANDRLLVFFGALCRGGASGTPCSGPLGKGLGTGIAALNMESETVARLDVTGTTPVQSIEGADPTLLFPSSEGFSDAAIVVGEYAYVYGNCTYVGCDVGRVPLADITDRADWLFYTASGSWSTSLSDAARVIAPGGAGQTVFYDPALRAYVNVFMPYGTDDVDFQVGGSPFGPWSSTVVAGHTPGGAKVDYALFAHPEFAQENGLIQYLTYFDPNTGRQCLYKLRFTP